MCCVTNCVLCKDGPEKRSIARASSMDLLTLDDDEDVTSYDSMATAAGMRGNGDIAVSLAYCFICILT